MQAQRNYLQMVVFLENASLRKLHTFATEAQACYFLEFSEVLELQSYIRKHKDLFKRVLVLGGGSNLLFTGDFPGLVLHPAIKGISVEREDEHHAWVRAGAGEIWDDFVAFAVAAGWGGVENLSLIPGTVGAVPVQNIGAYGQEASQVISSVRALTW